MLHLQALLPCVSQAPVYGKGAWSTPLGEIAVDEELADAVLKSGLAVADEHAHQYEHSIEVQVPFVQHFFSGAKILPILAPPNKQAITLGDTIGQLIDKEQEKKESYK